MALKVWKQNGKLLVNSAGELIKCVSCPCVCQPCTDGIPSQWLILFSDISYDEYFPPESAPCYDGDFDNCCFETCENYNTGFYFVGNRTYEEITIGEIVYCAWRYTGPGECDHTIELVMTREKGDPDGDLGIDITVRDTDTPGSWIEDMGQYAGTYEAPRACISNPLTVAYNGFTGAEPMDCNFRNATSCFITGVA